MRLDEIASDKLYHFTGLHNAEKILANRAFRLSAAVGTQSELEKQKGDRFYYLSTSRSKIGDYTVNGAYATGVVFVLNGRWFNERYRATAIDYWDSWWVAQRKAGSDRHREMEDRIYSREQMIELPSQITAAVMEMHLFVREDQFENGYDQAAFNVNLRRLLLNAKKLGLPTFFYTDKRAFLVQDKRKTVPISELMPKLRGVEPKAYQRFPRDYLKPYRELYHKTAAADLSKEASDLLYQIRYDWRDEKAKSLAADIHNERTANPPSVAKLLKLFQKARVRTPREFIQVLKDKWGISERG